MTERSKNIARTKNPMQLNAIICIGCVDGISLAYYAVYFIGTKIYCSANKKRAAGFSETLIHISTKLQAIAYQKTVN
jgi:hypothetical protein